MTAADDVVALIRAVIARDTVAYLDAYRSLQREGWDDHTTGTLTASVSQALAARVRHGGPDNAAVTARTLRDMQGYLTADLLDWLLTVAPGADLKFVTVSRRNEDALGDVLMREAALGALAGEVDAATVAWIAAIAAACVAAGTDSSEQERLLDDLRDDIDGRAWMVDLLRNPSPPSDSNHQFTEDVRALLERGADRWHLPDGGQRQLYNHAHGCDPRPGKSHEVEARRRIFACYVDAVAASNHYDTERLGEELAATLHEPEPYRSVVAVDLLVAASLGNDQLGSAHTEGNPEPAHPDYGEGQELSCHELPLWVRYDNSTRAHMLHRSAQRLVNCAAQLAVADETAGDLALDAMRTWSWIEMSVGLTDRLDDTVPAVSQLSRHHEIEALLWHTALNGAAHDVRTVQVSLLETLRTSHGKHLRENLASLALAAANEPTPEERLETARKAWPSQLSTADVNGPADFVRQRMLLDALNWYDRTERADGWEEFRSRRRRVFDAVYRAAYHQKLAEEDSWDVATFVRFLEAVAITHVQVFCTDDRW